MPAPTLYADVARKTNRSTLLIHDPDAIDTVDVNGITPGTAAATRNIEPRHMAVFGQAPTLQIRPSGAGGAHSVTVEIVVWGVDSRLITIGVPVKFNNVSVNSTGPTVSRMSLGVVFTEVQGWSIVAKSGSIQAGDNIDLGYDLDSDLVLLCDTSSQATMPKLFSTAVFGTPLAPVAAGNVDTLKRHTRWVTGKPTSSVGAAVLMIPPRNTVL